MDFSARLHDLQLAIGLRKNKTQFPIATFLINITGAFLLGYIIGNGVTTGWQLLLGTGFMGAFTTFSTLKLESVQLLNRKNCTSSFYI